MPQLLADGRQVVGQVALAALHRERAVVGLQPALEVDAEPVALGALVLLELGGRGGRLPGRPQLVALEVAAVRAGPAGQQEQSEQHTHLCNRGHRQLDVEFNSVIHWNCLSVVHSSTGHESRDFQIMFRASQDVQKL